MTDKKKRQTVERYAEDLFVGDDDKPKEDDPDRKTLRKLFDPAPPEKPNRFEK